LKKHGFDFTEAALLDWAGAVLEPAKADQFGRQRFKAIGLFSGSIASIIFAMLGSEAISIISFRPASAEERKKFYEQDKASH
jgi:uncharacterized protein